MFTGLLTNYMEDSTLYRVTTGRRSFNLINAFLYKKQHTWPIHGQFKSRMFCCHMIQFRIIEIVVDNDTSFKVMSLFRTLPAWEGSGTSSKHTNSLKVPQWSNSWYIFFYIFVHNWENLLRSLEPTFFGPLFPRIYGRWLRM